MRVLGAPPLRSTAAILLAALSLLSSPILNAGRVPGASPRTQSLVLNTSVLDFGRVVVGASRTLAIKAENTTDSSITITTVAANHPEFTLSSPALPVAVAANQSVILNLTFTPSAAGNGGAIISVASNLPEPPDTVLAAAVGVAEAQLTANPTSLAFGVVKVGSSQTITETLTNSSNSVVLLSQVSLSGSGFQMGPMSLPVTLAVGQSVAFSVTFTPQSSGAASGVLSVTSAFQQSQTQRRRGRETMALAMTGTGSTPGQLTVSPVSLNFGNVQTGSSQKQSVAISNSGGTSLTVSQATVTGAGFTWSGLTLPMTLTPGQSASLSVTFAPQSAGNVSGNLAISSDGSNSPTNVGLTGTGLAAGLLTVIPGSMSFGSIQVGSNQKQSAVLTNTGGTTVAISQATISGSGFTLSGISAPLTLAANQSTTFSVTFAPQASGNASGTVTFVSDAKNTPLLMPLSGAGVAPGALTASPSNLGFGSVPVGSSQTLSETLTNSGGSSVTISQATPTGNGFSLSGLSLPLTLTAGQSKTFSVAFAPQTTGAVSGNLAVVSDGSNPMLNVPLAGTGTAGGTLAAMPASISFGSVQVGNSSSQSETLTNTGGSSVTISQATATGSGFSINGLNPPVTLTAGQSYTFTAIFAPVSAGAASGSISVVSNGSNPNLMISLSGTGTAPGQLGVSPATLNFGNVAVGTSKGLTGTLSATGSSVTVSGVGISDSEYVLSGMSFPLTLGSGQSASFTMTFTPQAPGSVSATASFASNASNSLAVQSLTGAGTGPPTHSVDLSWSSSMSPVNGYNVYRSGKSGGPYTKMNSPLDPNTSYTDSTVLAGQTYYYVTTAVDSDGTESTYSNEVPAAIPTP